MLVGREDRHQAFDRSYAVAGVDGGEHEMTGFGSDDGRPDGVQIADLAHQDHVGILAQRCDQGFVKTRRIGAHLPLIDQRGLGLMDVLDGVLDGHDMTLPGAVDPVQKCRQGGALAGTRGPGHHDQAIGQVAQLVEIGGEAQFRQFAEPVFQSADSDRQPPLTAKDIEPVAGALGAGHGAVQGPGVLQRSPMEAGRQVFGDAHRVSRRERGLVALRLQHSFDPQVWRQIGHQVQVGSVLTHALRQQRFQQPHRIAGRRGSDRLVVTGLGRHVYIHTKRVHCLSSVR